MNNGANLSRTMLARLLDQENAVDSWPGDGAGFYRPLIAGLQASPLLECVPLDGPASGNTFFSYFIFPRDERRSLRTTQGYVKGFYRGLGVALYLCANGPVAAYGAVEASRGPTSASADWLTPERVGTLPAPHWADVEADLHRLLDEHGLHILSRIEAESRLSIQGLPPPLESNLAEDTDRVFYAVFNNAY